MTDATAKPRYRAVLFDAFRTLVTVGEAAPMMRVDEPGWRGAMAEVLVQLAAVDPRFAPERFLGAFEAVTRELGHQRRQSQQEIPLADRYEATCRRLGWPEERIRTLVPVAVEVHRAEVQAHCHVSREAQDVIRYLQSLGLRLAVVSNFDDSASLDSILARDQVRSALQALVVSVDVGVRKPHPAIYRHALACLEARPEEALFVGDSFDEDVLGPQAVGICSAWLAPSNAAAEERKQARFCLARLSDLRQLFG